MPVLQIDPGDPESPFVTVRVICERCGETLSTRTMDASTAETDAIDAYAVEDALAAKRHAEHSPACDASSMGLGVREEA